MSERRAIRSASSTEKVSDLCPCHATLPEVDSLPLDTRCVCTTRRSLVPTFHLLLALAFALLAVAFARRCAAETSSCGMCGVVGRNSAVRRDWRHVTPQEPCQRVATKRRSDSRILGRHSFLSSARKPHLGKSVLATRYPLLTRACVTRRERLQKMSIGQFGGQSALFHVSSNACRRRKALVSNTVGLTGIEPALPKELDPKSSASASSATAPWEFDSSIAAV